MKTNLLVRRSVPQSHFAFTLVELLVVIAIIGVLVALLLPAIQAAREAARNSQCKNSLKNISLAMINYESANKTFPAGGWGFRWMGDPNQSVGARQPGGWIYQVAPYVEQGAITLVGGGLSGIQLRNALVQQAEASMEIFNCPSRRRAIPFEARETNLFNCGIPEVAAKTDYAANGGHQRISTGPGPNPLLPGFNDCADKYPNCQWLIPEQNVGPWNGIVTDHRGARLGQITDGASKTFLVGEKWVFPFYYEVATTKPVGQEPSDNPGDNGSMYQGYDFDNVRWTGANFSDSGQPQGTLPKSDHETVVPGTSPPQAVIGNTYVNHMGGPHPGGVNMATCDGAVKAIDFEVDPLVWNALGGRDDGNIN